MRYSWTKLLVVEPLQQRDRLLDEIAHRLEQQKAAWRNSGGAIAESVDEGVHVEVPRVGPEVQQALAGGEVDARRQQDQVLHHSGCKAVNIALIVPPMQ